MKVEQFKHHFGERVVITTDSGQVIEIMRFRREGKQHRHESDELAECISGAGWVWSGHGFPAHRARYKAGDTCTIPAGAFHYMEPDPEAAKPFEWVIRYPGRDDCNICVSLGEICCGNREPATTYQCTRKHGHAGKCVACDETEHSIAEWVPYHLTRDWSDDDEREYTETARGRVAVVGLPAPLCRWWIKTRPCRNGVQINDDGIPPCVEFYVPCWAWPFELVHRFFFGPSVIEGGES